MNTLMDIEVLLCAATAIITVKDHPMSRKNNVFMNTMGGDTLIVRYDAQGQVIRAGTS